MRALNEDRLSADAELGLVILADGMGGQAAGSHAAELAVATVHAEVTRALANLRVTPTPNENYAIALAIRGRRQPGEPGNKWKSRIGAALS